jgi:hypothetical protein
MSESLPQVMLMSVLVLTLATLATAQPPPPVARLGNFTETVHNWDFPVMLLFEQRVFDGQPIDDHTNTSNPDRVFLSGGSPQAVDPSS